MKRDGPPASALLQRRELSMHSWMCLLLIASISFCFCLRNEKLTIRCWTGLRPWLCPCRCRCRRILLLLLRLFASRRRSLLGFSSAPRTLTSPPPPPHLPSPSQHRGTPPPKQWTEGCSQTCPATVARCFVFGFFFLFCCTNQQSGLVPPPSP